MVVGEQDYYYSSSDSDDEDVSRYVFLARQPVPVGRHHPEEDDRDASFANDDDDGDGGDGTAGEEESEGGVCRRKKRPLLEILDDDAPPPTKKAQVELIIASPLATQTPPSGSESNLASPPLAGESGSEGSHEHRAPREQGRAKNATEPAGRVRQARQEFGLRCGWRPGRASARCGGGGKDWRVVQRNLGALHLHLQPMRQVLR